LWCETASIAIALRGGATVGGNARRASATAQASPIRRPRAPSQISAPTIAPGVPGTLAYLPPRIIQAIVECRAPADMTVTRLTRNLPLPWTEREEQLGLG
jgi:hypothetical protein